MVIAPSTETFLKTSLSLGALSAVASTAGYLMGGFAGLYISMSVCVLTSFLSYWYSREVALYAFGAKEVTPTEITEGFNVHKLVTDLLQNEFKDEKFIKTPKICVIKADGKNAFATGPNKEHCAIAITTGLLRAARDNAKTQEQAEGWIKAILCHEIGHVTNHDIAIKTAASILAGIVRCTVDGYAYLRRNSKDEVTLASTLQFFLVHTLLSTSTIMLNLCLSRAREYAADDTAAKHGYAKELAEAFELLRSNDPNDKQPLAMSSLNAMCCSSLNPKRDSQIASGLQDKTAPWYSKTANYMAGFFSTHPDLDSRVQRMEKYLETGATASLKV